MATMDEVMTKLEHALDDFGFETDDLGNRIVNTMAQVISDRGLARQEGAHGPFRENTPATAAEKMDLYGHARPNTAVGHMLSLDSVKGQPEISQREIKWVYGTNSMTLGAPASYHQRTDKQKAEYAHGARDGGAHDRPFFELNDEDQADVQTIVAAQLVEELKARLG